MTVVRPRKFPVPAAFKPALAFRGRLRKEHADQVELVVDGVRFGKVLRRYLGEPTPEQLADPRLLLVDFTTDGAGYYWPGSWLDMTNRTLPGHALRRRESGKWPNDEEREAQRRAAAKLERARRTGT